MAICKKCGVYVRRSRKRRHEKVCAGGSGYPEKHMILSRGSRAQVEKAKKKRMVKQ